MLIAGIGWQIGNGANVCIVEESRNPSCFSSGSEAPTPVGHAASGLLLSSWCASSALDTGGYRFQSPVNVRRVKWGTAPSSALGVWPISLGQDRKSAGWIGPERIIYGTRNSLGWAAES
jgi:hypothetical protein